MLLTYFLIFLSFSFLITLTLYSMTPFIFIIFLTAVTFILGLLLVLNDLLFAGAVLIIVNAGAIAMVFLFVCVLSSRKTVVNRLPSLHVTLINSFLLIFFFWVSNIMFCWAGSLYKDSVNVLFTQRSSSAISHLVSFSDWSVASHFFLIENNAETPGILFLLGFLLLVSMCVAILITKRTLKSGF